MSSSVSNLDTASIESVVPTEPETSAEILRIFSSAIADRDIPCAFKAWVREGANGYLWVAYPIVREGLRRFRAASRSLGSSAAPFHSASVEELFLPNLLRMLKPFVTSTMTLELNVARIRGALTGATAEERFRSFCDSLCLPQTRSMIVREYPILFHTLYTKMTHWVSYSVELLDRLIRDWSLIAKTFGVDPGTQVLSIEAGAGDSHAQGRTVAILSFNGGFKLVYKPRRQSLDVHFAQLLEWINARGFDPGFRPMKVIDREVYGWAEFIEHAPCASRDQLERFYQRLGGYLALFYALHACDMHYDNLIAAGEYPVPIDLEALFHPEVQRDDPAANALQRSVLQVLLLPLRIFSSETQQGVDISGLGAKNGQSFPAGTIASWQAAATDEMCLVRDQPVLLGKVRSQPMLGAQAVNFEDFREAFLTGFERCYRLLANHGNELTAPQGILERFSRDEVRFIRNATPIYSMLLDKAYHPDNLRDAATHERVFQLLESGAGQASNKRLATPEREDLLSGDIPIFYSRPFSRDVWTSLQTRLLDVLHRSPMEIVHGILHGLGEADLARQLNWIRATVGISSEVAETAARSAAHCVPSFDADLALQLARTFGEQLCAEVYEDDRYANWIGVGLDLSHEDSWSLQPLQTDLYSGLGGCALFLANLGLVTGERRYTEIARKSIALAQNNLRERANHGFPMGSIGGFTGLGGNIYCLAHLGTLWGDASLISEAFQLTEHLAGLVDGDSALDVVRGSAGCIGALFALNTKYPDERLLRAAMLCGDRLLETMQTQAVGSAWATDIKARQPLTGFSHGAAGFAWALIKLAAWSKEQRFREAADSAMAYERSTFQDKAGNWPDYRALEPAHNHGGDATRCMTAWCHGASGIALARLDNLPYRDDQLIRQEIQVALERTVEAPWGKNLCLCHGDLGNLDVLLQAGQRVKASWWTETGERIAGETLRRLAHRGASCDGHDRKINPGLMSGLAGIGYGLLRLARPDEVPSLLVLAPPG